MTGYAEMDRIRKKARPLYLELRALDLELRVVKDLSGLAGYRVRVSGYASLSDRHRDRIAQRVEECEPGLVKILRSQWDQDLAALREEGGR